MLPLPFDGGSLVSLYEPTYKGVSPWRCDGCGAPVYGDACIYCGCGRPKLKAAKRPRVKTRQAGKAYDEAMQRSVQASIAEQERFERQWGNPPKKSLERTITAEKGLFFVKKEYLLEDGRRYYYVDEVSLNGAKLDKAQWKAYEYANCCTMIEVLAKLRPGDKIVVKYHATGVSWSRVGKWKRVVTER